MKRTLVSLMLAMFLMLGCVTAFPAQADTAEEPIVIELTKCLLYNDTTEFVELKDAFPAMFKEATGYEIKVNIMPRTDYITNLNLKVMSGTLTGLVQTFGTSDLIRYKADDVIQPITAAVADNEIWKSMPQDYQESTLFDGEVWGIPQGYTTNMFVRSFRQDWLDNLGLQAPTTVDELMEVARAFTEDDPDGNGQNDTFGLTAAGTWNLQDIFQAFDARLDDTGSLSIGYDPMLGAFTDTMVKPEMVEALTYLRTMYEKGYLDPETFANNGATMREKMWSGKYGSTFYWNAWASVDTITNFTSANPDAKIVEVPVITGKRTEKVNLLAAASGAPIVMMKDTPNADAMVAAFLDACFGSEKGHLAARFGGENVTFKKEEGAYVRLLDPASGNPFPLASVVSEIPQYGAPSGLYTIVDGTPEEEAKSLESAKLVYDAKEKALSDPRFYQAQYSTIISDTYNMISADITKAYEECVTAAITGTMSVEDAIATYKSVMASIDAAKVITETNEAYGFTVPDVSYN